MVDNHIFPFSRILMFVIVSTILTFPTLVIVMFPDLVFRHVFQHTVILQIGTHGLDCGLCLFKDSFVPLLSELVGGEKELLDALLFAVMFLVDFVTFALADDACDVAVFVVDFVLLVLHLLHDAVVFFVGYVACAADGVHGPRAPDFGVQHVDRKSGE